MPKFFSRTGDDGTSGLLGDGRVKKDDPRFDAIGTLDEANSVLGIARSVCKQPSIKEIIFSIQRDIYKMMAEISATPENASRFRAIDGERVQWLEDQTTSIGNLFEMPNEFIVPGDTLAGGILDLARTIIRRAERRASTLLHQRILENKEILRYLNRLSSLCFVLELWETLATQEGQISLAKNEDELK